MDQWFNGSISLETHCWNNSHGIHSEYWEMNWQQYSCSQVSSSQPAWTSRGSTGRPLFTARKRSHQWPLQGLTILDFGFSILDFDCKLRTPDFPAEIGWSSGRASKRAASVKGPKTRDGSVRVPTLIGWSSGARPRSSPRVRASSQNFP